MNVSLLKSFWTTCSAASRLTQSFWTASYHRGRSLPFSVPLCLACKLDSLDSHTALQHAANNVCLDLSCLCSDAENVMMNVGRNEQVSRQLELTQTKLTWTPILFILWRQVGFSRSRHREYWGFRTAQSINHLCIGLQLVKLSAVCVCLACRSCCYCCAACWYPRISLEVQLQYLPRHHCS